MGRSMDYMTYAFAFAQIVSLIAVYKGEMSLAGSYCSGLPNLAG